MHERWGFILMIKLLCHICTSFKFCSVVCVAIHPCGVHIILSLNLSSWKELMFVCASTVSVNKTLYCWDWELKLNFSPLHFRTTCPNVLLLHMSVLQKAKIKKKFLFNCQLYYSFKVYFLHTWSCKSGLLFIKVLFPKNWLWSALPSYNIYCALHIYHWCEIYLKLTVLWGLVQSKISQEFFWPLQCT